MSSLGIMPWKGHPQGVPYRLSSLAFGPGKGNAPPIVFSRRLALKGAHKGCPYRLSSLGVCALEGRPQGVPLIVFSRRLALRRAPTRGLPLPIASLGVWPWEGHPQGVPLPFVWRLALGEGTHKGCPYRLSSPRRSACEGAHKGCPYLTLGVRPCEGHPQGVLLPFVFSAFPGKGAHKGRPSVCLLSAFACRCNCPAAPTDCLLAFWPWGGHPQGVALMQALQWH